MLKRIINFKRHDFKHIGYLLYNSVIQLLKGNLSESMEALYWVWVHLNHDSKQVEEGEVK